MSDQHKRRPSFTCIDAASQRKNFFSLANVQSAVVPPTISTSFSSRNLIPPSLLGMNATFDSAMSDSPPQQEVPKTSPLRRMLTFGASVLTKVATRAETLPAPKPVVLASTTLASAGRIDPAAAGPTPSSKSNRKLLPQFAAADSDLRFGARRVGRPRGARAWTTFVTREQHSQFPIKSAFSRFKCATCGQGYSSAGSLALHERVHQGEKPYVCPLCREGFITAAKLHPHNISERSGARQN